MLMLKRSEREALIQLLQIKDSDIRILTVEQGRTAVDQGIHSGGAFSAVIPLTALFYGGFMNYRVDDPTADGQDIFVLSKGHAVAAMASIYADLGYFSMEMLKNSRSAESLLNGHPGPILPGVHVSTGPLGQGCCAAQGFAAAGKLNTPFDVYSLLGDGELQEGIVWEAVMYAAHKRLDNLCFIIDKNHGQLDRSDAMILPMDRAEDQFSGFGWKVVSVDGMQYGQLLDALQEFKEAPRTGRPTVIISNTEKGYGAFSQYFTNHKITLSDKLASQEAALQKQRRGWREAQLLELLDRNREDNGLTEFIQDAAKRMNLIIADSVKPAEPEVKLKRAPQRDKRIHIDVQLPVLNPEASYSASEIITSCMKEYARDARIASIDADLATTSGLQSGVGHVDRHRALNVGIAEANMMNIGEAFASLGYQTWVSTFCPFFDIKVLRRIAISQQERLEAIELPDGWLSKGHGLDLTFLATAPNLETRTNGATHMGNDDIMIINEIGSIRIIDVSCPNQLIGILKWVMEGNKGLLYIRIMRAPSAVIYPEVVNFEYGKGYYAVQKSKAQAVIISSGRGVFEAVEASRLLEENDQLEVSVVDMPSLDTDLLLELYDSGMTMLFAEQNNGYLWNEFRKAVFAKPSRTTVCLAVNTSDSTGRPHYIHSATYEQMLDQFGLSPKNLAETLRGSI